MMRNAMMAVFVAAAWLPPMQAQAAAVRGLLADAVQNLRGEKLGAVEELIVDVRAGRVVYVVVDSAEKFYTLPVRAFDERVRLVRRESSDERKRLHDPQWDRLW